MAPLKSVSGIFNPKRVERKLEKPFKQWTGTLFEWLIKGYEQSIFSMLVSFSSKWVICGLFSQIPGKGVLTSVKNRPGYLRWRSRTAAVNITMSPAEYPHLSRSLR